MEMSLCGGFAASECITAGVQGLMSYRSMAITAIGRILPAEIEIMIKRFLPHYRLGQLVFQDLKLTVEEANSSGEEDHGFDALRAQRALNSARKKRYREEHPGLRGKRRIIIRTNSPEYVRRPIW